MQSVVITGVSTGIGYCTAKLFTSRGIKVFGSVRNQADATRLQQELGALYVPLLFDVTDAEKIQVAAQLVREQLQGHTLWGLINNAGIAVSGAMMNIPLPELRKQLEVNVFGQVMVTQAFIPLLGADKNLQGAPGKIINISSVAGKITYPFMGPYSMSKYALEAFTEALRRELIIFGIDAITVGPGPVESQIWDKAKNEALTAELENSIFKQPAEAFKKYMTTARKASLPAEYVAKLLLQILQAKNPKVRYAPVPNKWIYWLILYLLPKRWFDRAIAKQFGLINNLNN